MFLLISLKEQTINDNQTIVYGYEYFHHFYSRSLPLLSLSFFPPTSSLSSFVKLFIGAGVFIRSGQVV